MAAATMTTSSKLRPFTECSICLEILSDPRILPCQHSYCLRCLQGSWASKKPKDTVHCPLCREEFVIPAEGICGIRKDHRVNAMMDVFYGGKTANKSHFCGEHKDKALDLYCQGCKTAICSSCLIKSHSGHSVCEVREFLNETRKQMAEELGKLSIYEEEMNQRKTSLKDYGTRFLKEIDRAEKAINKKAEELKLGQLIEQRRLSLIEELSTIKQKQLKEIMMEREEMENYSAEIESIKQICNTIARTENPIDISRAMTDFSAIRDKLAENPQVQLECPLSSTKFSFQPTTSEEDHSTKNIIGSITSVTMRLIKTLDISDTHGLTKLGNNIYILRSPSNFLISVYEDQNPFRLQAEIHINEIKIAVDIASSEKSKCLYVTDSVNNCIWKITVDDHRVTRWLSDIGDPFTLSVTSDDHILKLRDGGRHSQLEIYGSDANLIRVLPLSTDIQWPLQAVQKPSGQFLIMHKEKTGCCGPWFVSQLTSDGKVISRCLLSTTRNIEYPWHLSLDSEKSRLFLTSCSADRVILLDTTSHNWNQIRLTEEEGDDCGVLNCDKCRELFRHLSVHYDTSKRQLLIGHTYYIGLLIVELR